MKILCRLTLMGSLVFSFSSLAQTSLSTVTGQNADSIYNKVSPEEAADLALSGFAGNCRAFAPVGASYIYKLTYLEGGALKTLYYGRRASYDVFSAPMAEVNRSMDFLRQLNNLVGMPMAHAAVNNVDLSVSALATKAYTHATNLTWSLPVYSASDMTSARTSLGTKVKSLVAAKICTGVRIDKFNLKMNAIQESDITFYRGLSNEILCKSGQFTRYIREANGCNMVPVVQVLPSKLCNGLYVMLSKKYGRIAKNTTSTSLPPRSIAFGNYAEIAEAVQLNQVFEQAPHLIHLTASADVPVLEQTINIEHLEKMELIKAATDKLAYFNSLPDIDKQKVVAVYYAQEAAKKDMTNNLQFSSDFASQIAAVEPAITTYIAANQNLTLSMLPVIPQKNILEAEIATQLSPITNITHTVFNTHLNCIQQMSAQAVNVQATAKFE